MRAPAAGLSERRRDAPAGPDSEASEAAAWAALVPLLNGADPNAARQRLRDGPPAEVLAALLYRHGLAATVRASLQAHDLWGELPTPVSDLVRDARRRQRILAVQSLDCMRELGAELHARALPHLFLKGPLLSQRVYGELEARSVGDVDLLVRPEAVEAAEAGLLRLGFEPRYRTLWGRRLSRAFTHHFAFARERQTVELHWLPAREPGVRSDLRRLWGESEQLEVRGVRYPVPSLETSLLIQILTIVKDLELGQFRLRSAVDVLRILEATAQEGGEGRLASWRERFVWLGSQGLARLAPVALALALRLLDAHGRFPGLEGEIARHELAVPDPKSTTLGLQVFGCRPPAWRNKQQLFRLHRGGALPTWTWWAITLPWRRRVYAH